MKSYKEIFNKIKGIYFPLLIIKRIEKRKFKSEVEEIEYEREKLSEIGIKCSKVKFYYHVLTSYGIVTLIKYIKNRKKK